MGRLDGLAHTSQSVVNDRCCSAPAHALAHVPRHRQPLTAANVRATGPTAGPDGLRGGCAPENTAFCNQRVPAGAGGARVPEGPAHRPSGGIPAHSCQGWRSSSRIGCGAPVDVRTRDQAGRDCVQTGDGVHPSAPDRYLPCPRNEAADVGADPSGHRHLDLRPGAASGETGGAGFRQVSSREVCHGEAWRCLRAGVGALGGRVRLNWSGTLCEVCPKKEHLLPGQAGFWRFRVLLCAPGSANEFEGRAPGGTRAPGSPVRSPWPDRSAVGDGQPPRRGTWPYQFGW